MVLLALTVRMEMELVTILVFVQLVKCGVMQWDILKHMKNTQSMESTMEESQIKNFLGKKLRVFGSNQLLFGIFIETMS